MRTAGALLCLSLLNGCSFLGYYKLKKAERAPVEEAAKIKFPNSFESGTAIDGPMRAAVEVAMNDFLPPGTKVTLTDGYQPLEQCLSNRSTYDVVALRSNEGVIFVNIVPVMARCKLDATLLDAGAVYAVDEKGRILNVH